ncbi:hypothetical protein CkaCkLH20_10155 [Colletotrichum karsti]|uniref:Heterokaryon incompatibility domain-containing protein n=1 Tax=Colletotrichum karsti TaxID=1095194 RepID=A0A9P6HWV9_9PEZI|nr:uncharacterized protein CkaCkLH20_10155 [Colletotrichum karsti]KAF9872328.1 hypothetical protein CkaCkLH20_10155 [Colletotrichum karsti]
MWLINAQTLALEEFLDNAAPSYAILSHTWKTEEVSFQDFRAKDPVTINKLGYTKIKEACAKALEYGYQHVWVDTCCIDKTSSAELSESINSMFKWYEAAEVCFAYLSDVPPTKDATDPAFVKSRWWTRGWTLQELLAPSKLDFFAADWTVIASRDDTASAISSITGINERYLRSPSYGRKSRLGSLATASVAERMSWAARRTTTRTEDIAYCLLGIFGVNMPLIYGEGPKAFIRLQEQIIQTCFDSTLLAWNLSDEYGRPQPYEEAAASSPVRSALKMIVGMDHPWAAREQPHFSDPPVGLLAPGPEHFLLCNDVVECETVLMWTPTSRGLEIELPVSANTWAYAILPCRLRSDPWTLIAIPLTIHEGGAYSRSSHSAMRLAGWYRSTGGLLTE